MAKEIKEEAESQLYGNFLDWSERLISSSALMSAIDKGGKE